MLEIAYGRTIAAHDEDFVSLASNAILRLTEAGSPSASLVDFIPICELRREDLLCSVFMFTALVVRHMPTTWLPGSAWKRKALKVRNSMHEAMTIPYEKTKRAVVCLFPPLLHMESLN